MADWERRLAEEAQETRDDLERRTVQGGDSASGFFNIANNFVGQYLLLYILIILAVVVALVIWLFANFSPAGLKQYFQDARDRVHAEQEAESAGEPH